MKTWIQASAFAFIIHIGYAATSVFAGYIQTKMYKPDFHGKVTSLQNEVAFGYVINPAFLSLSFIGMAAVCAGIIFIYKKWAKNGSDGSK
ncbi:MAG TPA: hypothetical protein VIG80_05180 [Bacillaceae bacterium]